MPKITKDGGLPDCQSLGGTGGTGNGKNQETGKVRKREEISTPKQKIATRVLYAAA